MNKTFCSSMALLTISIGTLYSTQVSNQTNKELFTLKEGYYYIVTNEGKNYDTLLACDTSTNKLEVDTITYTPNDDYILRSKKRDYHHVFQLEYNKDKPKRFSLKAKGDSDFRLYNRGEAYGADEAEDENENDISNSPDYLFGFKKEVKKKSNNSSKLDENTPLEKQKFHNDSTTGNLTASNGKILAGILATVTMRYIGKKAYTTSPLRIITAPSN